MLCRACPGVCEEYSVPYHDKVQADPSLKEMRAVVAEARYRPCIEKRWTTNEVSEWVGQWGVVGRGGRDLVRKMR